MCKKTFDLAEDGFPKPQCSAIEEGHHKTGLNVLNLLLIKRLEAVVTSTLLALLLPVLFCTTTPRKNMIDKN